MDGVLLHEGVSVVTEGKELRRALRVVTTVNGARVVAGRDWFRMRSLSGHGLGLLWAGACVHVPAGFTGFPAMGLRGGPPWSFGFTSRRPTCGAMINNQASIINRGAAARRWEK